MLQWCAECSLNVYGHPEAGRHWEVTREADVKRCGFISIPEHRAIPWHPSLRALLVIFVDDIKLAIPGRHLACTWSDLRKRIRMDPAPPDSS